MKSFSDKTNIGTDVTLKTVYMIRFYLLFLLTGIISVVGATQVYGQQSRSISGVVKNSQGETIIGANIVEKGTNNGTITTACVAQRSTQSILHGIHRTGSQHT